LQGQCRPAQVEFVIIDRLAILTQMYMYSFASAKRGLALTQLLHLTCPCSFACVGGPWRLQDGPGQCFQTYGLVARDASEEDEESAALSAVAEAAAAAEAAEAAAAAGCGKLELTSLKS
jgi:hypothetical protein